MSFLGRRSQHEGLGYSILSFDVRLRLLSVAIAAIPYIIINLND